MANKKHIKVDASEISFDDLKVMLAEQISLNALMDRVEKARLQKSDLNGQSFNDCFFKELRNCLRKT